MDLFAAQPQRARRVRKLALAAVSLLGFATVAAADFRLTDPTSAVYYTKGLAAGAQLKIGERAAVTGNVHSNGTLDLGEHGTVAGNVSAVGKLTNHGSVTGSVTSPAPALTLPVLASKDDLKRLANRVLTGNQKLTDAVINDILFVDGTVTLRGSIKGTGTLIAAGDIQVNEAEGSTPPLDAATRLSFIALNDIKLSEKRALRGALYAGRDVTLGEQASFEGVVVARRNLTLGERGQFRFLNLDTSAPGIQVLQPPEGALLTTATPTIQATWTDNLSGVNLATLRFLLDGVDRKAQAAVTATGLTFTPAPGLPDGAHTIDLTLADYAGNTAHAVSHFTTSTRPTDTTPPAVTITSPAEGQAFTSSPIQVTGTVTDASAISSVTVNGQAVPLSGGAFTASVALTAGANTITVAATDAAGNVGQAVVHVTFQTDRTPPAITITSPPDGQTVGTASLPVSGTATDASGIASVTVSGQPAVVSGGTFSALVVLVDGLNTITATATDLAGNVNQAVVHVTLQRDTTAPRIAITAPVSGTFVLLARPEIDVTYSDADSGIDPATLRVTANGADLPVTCQGDDVAARCTPGASLPDGPLTLTASIADRANNRGSASGHFVVDTAGLTVTLASPADGLITQADQVTVQGTVSAGVTQVAVNGVAAALAGNSFSADLPLHEGVNMIVAVGTKTNGRTGASSVKVTRDLQAPIVRITSPRDGLVSASSHVAVTGQVNDTVTGGAVPRVQVNGADAGVAGGGFMLESVELVPGPNTITAVATDAVGNSGEHAVTVIYQPPAGNRVVLAAGNGQSAPISSPLPAPLVVAVQDDAGNPVAGSLVRFEVTRNSGTLQARAGDPPQRSLQAATDGSGRASVLLTLGDTSGDGNNRVRATALGAAGEVEFGASATPGPAGAIALESGDNQRGVTGQPLALPLTVFVSDASGNPLPGVAVTFAVIQGTGNLDGAASAARTTDADGLARAVLMLGSDPGVNNNVVTASVPGLEGLPVTFTSSGVAPGDPALTSLSGVVLDDGLTPIPGVEVLILGTSLHGTTDAQGRFSIQGTPVGLVHLHVDPAQSPRPETFPPLPVETVLIAGQNNVLEHPVLLPKLALENSKVVGGPADVTLTMAGVEGLSLTVFANSATFPDGSKTGQLTISQVHLDKVPSAPPMGGLFMPPAWSIQPPNVKFDPPARMTIPNNGLPPGRVIDIFQFDHELNQFVVVGKGTVSEDGSVIVADDGFGILAAGWGGGGPQPPPQTCGNHCKPAPVCKKNGRCVNGVCEFDNEAMCKSCRLGTMEGQCDGNGTCVPFAAGAKPTGRITFNNTVSCTGTDTLAITKKSTFEAKDLKDTDEAVPGCPTKDDKISNVRWTFSAGTPLTATGKKVKWEAPQTAANVMVMLEVDDDGKVADDGGFMMIDSKQIAVVIPDTDHSNLEVARTCPPGRTGRGDAYSATLAYQACNVKFQGLTVREQAPQLAVTMNTCHLMINNTSGGPGITIDSSNRYGKGTLKDNLVLCTVGDPVIAAPGCIWENQTQWLIGPMSVPYVVHTNRFTIPQGNLTSTPPGGYGNLTTSRNP